MDRSAVVTAVFEDGWNREQFDGIVGALSTFRFRAAGTSRDMTIDDLRSIVRRWRAGLPDLRFEIETLVESGDRVAVGATLTGTHLGTLHGVESTGRSVRVDHAFFFRFDRDRIVEVWEVLDSQGLRNQIGA